MIIKRAYKEDLSSINDLSTWYGFKPLTEDHFNNRDIAIAACYKDKIVGFVWCGLMCNQKVGYIDHFLVHPEFHKQGIGQELSKKLREVLNKRGVRQVFGFIDNSEFHNASAMNALKMAMGSNDAKYTYVSGDVQNSLKEVP